eukprot:CAMPEP_0197588058 /NCGR_PEP_ID=MMETSP1326-20131121/9478_1 /TAXON_ID=1155430 /ORGANISM="Genus nov. species nov., Strain RCC2288" /LENGTH=30 /DNA_ID= /DNA_START= /DNA_END= /DNA_ORIENTATION=
MANGGVTMPANGVPAIGVAAGAGTGTGVAP